MALTWNVNGYSVPASSTVPNILSGSTIEFVGQAATLTLYGTADAAGVTHTIFTGMGSSAPTLIAPGSGLGVASTPGSIKTNENFLGQWAIPGGSRLVHSVTNSAAAANKVNFMYLVQ